MKAFRGGQLGWIGCLITLAAFGRLPWGTAVSWALGACVVWGLRELWHHESTRGEL